MTQTEVKNLKDLDCIRKPLEDMGYEYKDPTGLTAIFSDEGDYSMVNGDTRISQQGDNILFHNRDIAIRVPTVNIIISAVYPSNISLRFGNLDINIEKEDVIISVI